MTSIGELYYQEKIRDELKIKNLLKMYELKLIGKNALKQELTTINTDFEKLL